MKLNERSLRNLEGVHPDLVRVVERAAELTQLKFIVTEGVRSRAKQIALVAAGASQTTRGRHVPENNACGMACAVDLAAWVDLDADESVDGGEIRWDWPLYAQLNEVMQEAAQIEGVIVQWGGNCWKTLKDGPHWQLPHNKYPGV